MSISITNIDHKTYNVTFFDKTILTTVDSDSSTVSKWISEVLEMNSDCLEDLVVGLDVEWGYSAPHQPNPVSTVQICVGERCLVYQIIHSKGDIPQSLLDFLSDDFNFVGVGVADDLRKLSSQYGIVAGEWVVDLRDLAEERYDKSELRQYGLKSLAKLVLGIDFEKSKSISVSNWANSKLTDEQVQYACVDAYVSYEIGRVLEASEVDSFFIECSNLKLNHF